MVEMLERVWAIVDPDPALNPTTSPELALAVQVKVAPGMLDVKGMFVVWPLQMEVNRGVVVRSGTAFTVTL